MDKEFTGWLTELAGPGGSDLYITAEASPMWRGDKGFVKLREKPLSPEECQRIVDSLLNEKQGKEFAATGAAAVRNGESA